MMASRVLVPLLVLVLPTRPDEGQWLPGQVREMDWDALRARGLELSKDELWHPERGGVLSAAVRFGGGCSASFVSPTGLIATNHHCGFAAVNALSSPEHNRLRDGYVAATSADELPCQGLSVSIVRRIVDVTARVHEAQASAESDLERFQRTEQIVATLVEEGEREPHTQCRVASFFEGREWHLIVQTVLKDVRLVYVPPRAIGEFGGEVDNWEWPRHTGDFSFFRAYAAPDGTPRDYDADNVPFRPEHALRVSREGVKAGDLVMVLGYPGRTQRYLTADAVADRAGVYYPLRHRLLTDVLAVLEGASKASEAKALQYASTIKSLANVQKNALGMVKGLRRNRTVELKQAEEQQFTAWVEQSAERKAKYGTVLADLRAVDAEERATTQKDLLLRLLCEPRVLPLLANTVQMVEKPPAPTEKSDDPAATDGSVRANARRTFGTTRIVADLESVQIPILSRLLQEARVLPPDQRLAGTTWLTSEDPKMPIEPLVGRLLTTTLLDPEARTELAAGGAEAIARSHDPLIELARGLADERKAMSQRDHTRAGRRLALGALWIEAQQAWRGKRFYPDANGTLRVSFATVKGYDPRDAVTYHPHTTVAGLLQKEIGEEPFANPPALLAAATKRRASRFADPSLGDVPVCFLSDGDTTGGNSGSCLIDGKGQLVGLNFDRVFENVSGDFGWNADRSRNISVDVRYLLWVMEDVLPAPHLVKELLRE
ncbi:MAG: S46 family peptidase [Planctomycetota bacterium]